MTLGIRFFIPFRLLLLFSVIKRAHEIDLSSNSDDFRVNYT